MTTTVERTKNAPWGLAGGTEARPNALEVELPDGTTTSYNKATRVPLPAGAVVHLHTGGGGGYGAPAERDAAAVHADVRDGYLSEARARADYPHAFAGHQQVTQRRTHVHLEDIDDLGVGCGILGTGGGGGDLPGRADGQAGPGGARPGPARHARRPRPGAA